MVIQGNKERKKTRERDFACIIDDNVPGTELA